MKAHAFATLLETLATSGDDVAARKFAALLKEAPATSTVAAAVEKLRAVQLEQKASSSNDATDSFGDLRIVLSRMSAVVRLVGTKASIDDCELVAAFVVERSQQPVEAFALAFAKPTRAASTSKSRATTVPNAAVIQSYVDRFQGAVPGSHEYEQIVRTLEADKSNAKVGELKAIAVALSVELPVKPTRLTALKAIERNHRIISDTLAKAAALNGQTAT